MTTTNDLRSRIEAIRIRQQNAVAGYDKDLADALSIIDEQQALLREVKDLVWTESSIAKGIFNWLIANWEKEGEFIADNIQPDIRKIMEINERIYRILTFGE